METTEVDAVIGSTVGNRATLVLITGSLASSLRQRVPSCMN